MKLEIDMPEHHYNNIIAFDSVSLGRVPYKGIIMYAINAIKRGKALEQEPTTKNDLGVNTDKLISDCEKMSFDIEIFNKPLKVVALDAVKNIVNDLPSVTPQEPKTGHWITWKEAGNEIASETRFECSVCHDSAQTLCNGLDLLSPYCPNCGAKMVEPQETETWNGIHAQITAPKGTFDKIFNDTEEDIDDI